MEEVARRRRTFALEKPGEAYAEIRDLLERRLSYDEVEEGKYFHDIEEGRTRSEITAMEAMDNHSVVKLETYLFIDRSEKEMDIQVKAKVVTHYETSGYKGSLWYYAYRALYDKFLYGHLRSQYEEAAEEKVDTLLERIRQNVEAEA